MDKRREEQIISSIDEFKNSILMEEFDKELDILEKEVIKSLKEAKSVDELYMCRGTIIALGKIKTIFATMGIKAQTRLNNKA